jgi:glutaredoxin
MITVYSIPDCPNCKHLKMLLDRERIVYESRMFDPDNDDDVAEMAYLGVLNAQFPVVVIDGERLPALTLPEYMERIKG